jgi:hypothetical protein
MNQLSEERSEKYTASDASIDPETNKLGNPCFGT